MTSSNSTTISSQHQLRAELEAMVLGDLLGPAAGENEELTERTVRDRYLVGVLAPSRAAGSGGKGADNSPASPTADPTLFDDDDDDDIPVIPDELSEGGSDSADDGKTDADIPLTQTYLPSSFGLSFCVDSAATTLEVEASWGQYKREKREDQTDYKGNPLRVWKRYPRGGTLSLPLSDGEIKAAAPDSQFPDVYVQGRVRRRKNHCIVTLFLVNAQEEQRPKDEFHLFQPKLTVRGPAGAAIFCKRNLPGAKDDLEERMMAMLYRHHVEFAVGHGVGVHVGVSPDSPEQATSIETAIVPSYEVPRTAPPTAADAADNPAFGKLSGLVLDMKMLAESSISN